MPDEIVENCGFTKAMNISYAINESSALFAWSNSSKLREEYVNVQLRSWSSITKPETALATQAAFTSCSATLLYLLPLGDSAPLFLLPNRAGFAVDDSAIWPCAYLLYDSRNRAKFRPARCAILATLDSDWELFRRTVRTFPPPFQFWRWLRKIPTFQSVDHYYVLFMTQSCWSDNNIVTHAWSPGPDFVPRKIQLKIFSHLSNNVDGKWLAKLGASSADDKLPVYATQIYAERAAETDDGVFFLPPPIQRHAGTHFSLKNCKHHHHTYPRHSFLPFISCI